MILLSLFNLSIRTVQKLGTKAGWHRLVQAHLRKLRREFLPTPAELEDSYLDNAVDRYDLEMRMRELDRAKSPGHRVY